MRWTDLPEIASVEAEVFPGEEWDERTWWAELALRPRRHYVLARAAAPEDATLLGYAGLDLGADVADVMTIAVTPAARGRGLGRRLLRDLLRTADDADLPSVMLEVRADNGAAIALYRAHGFDDVRVRPRYYPGGVDALIMARPRPVGPGVPA